MPYAAVCVDRDAGIWRVVERATGRVIVYGLPAWIARRMARRMNQQYLPAA